MLTGSQNVFSTDSYFNKMLFGIIWRCFKQQLRPLVHACAVRQGPSSGRLAVPMIYKAVATIVYVHDASSNNLVELMWVCSTHAGEQEAVPCHRGLRSKPGSQHRYRAFIRVVLDPASAEIGTQNTEADVPTSQRVYVTWALGSFFSHLLRLGQ